MKRIIIVSICILITIQSVFAFSFTAKSFFGIFESIFGRGESPVGCGPRHCGSFYCRECEYCEMDVEHIDEQTIPICKQFDYKTQECIDEGTKTIPAFDAKIFFCQPSSTCSCTSCPSGNCECVVSGRKEAKCVDKGTDTTSPRPVNPVKSIASSECVVNQPCLLDITFECSDGLWIVTNRRSKPLAVPLIEEISEEKIQFVPKESGTLLIRAICFDPEIELLKEEISI